jgi:hypothetical protein
MPTRIFYRPKNFPKYITSSKPFAEWVAQWKGPEGIKPPGHGQVEVGRVNAEDVFVHSIETHAAKAKQAEEIDGLYGSGGAGEATWASRLGLENKVRETPHAVTKGVYSGDDPTGIGAYTSDLFDIGGPRSRVPIGSSVYDPKNLIKWGALGAGIAGTAVASDALATPSRVSGPIENQWKGDLVKQFQEMTAPNRETDDVGDRVIKSFAQGFLPPSPTDIKGATSWGVMPSQIASKMGSDISSQLTLLQEQTGLSRKELLLKIGKEMVFSPEGVGSLASIFLPGFHGKVPIRIKEGNLSFPIPRNAQGWTRRILQSDLDTWNASRTMTDTRIGMLMQAAIRNNADRVQGMLPLDATPDDLLRNPVVRSVFRDQLHIPLKVQLTNRTGIGGVRSGAAHQVEIQTKTGSGGSISLTDYIGRGLDFTRKTTEISRRTARLARNSLARYQTEIPSMRTAPTNPIAPTPILTHELAHFRWPDLHYSKTLPWERRPNEILAERAARIYSPLENFNKEYIPFGQTPDEYWNFIQRANARNNIIWSR